jgi:hypothetical protein
MLARSWLLRFEKEMPGAGGKVVIDEVRKIIDNGWLETSLTGESRRQVDLFDRNSFRSNIHSRLF